MVELIFAVLVLIPLSILVVALAIGFRPKLATHWFNYHRALSSKGLKDVTDLVIFLIGIAAALVTGWLTPADGAIKTITAIFAGIIVFASLVLLSPQHHPTPNEQPSVHPKEPAA